MAQATDDLRQRRGVHGDEPDTEPVDEIDQDSMIAELRRMNADSRQIHHVVIAMLAACLGCGTAYALWRQLAEPFGLDQLAVTEGLVPHAAVCINLGVATAVCGIVAACSVLSRAAAAADASGAGARNAASVSRRTALLARLRATSLALALASAAYGAYLVLPVWAQGAFGDQPVDSFGPRTPTGALTWVGAWPCLAAAAAHSSLGYLQALADADPSIKDLEALRYSTTTA